MFTKALLPLKGQVRRRGKKNRTFIQPLQFPSSPCLPFAWSRSLAQSGNSPESAYQLQKCRMCSNRSRFITLLERGRTGLVNGFSSSPLIKQYKQKESGREAEQKHREQLPSEQHVWPPRNVRGELSRVRPKLLDFCNPLSHVSVHLSCPTISHFKNISYPSEKLGLYTLLLKLCSGEPAQTAL